MPEDLETQCGPQLRSHDVSEALVGCISIVSTSPTRWRQRELLKQSIKALNTFWVITLLRDHFGSSRVVIRNRLFELYAMAPTAPLVPILTKKPRSAAESDPINRKDKLIEWRASNRTPSNRTELNRKPLISPPEPTESRQNRPIRTIAHPALRACLVWADCSVLLVDAPITRSRN